jgi:radical SAM protein with 4Fe4S-binding SPASM domain
MNLPTYIQFETSTACNQRCCFCPNGTGKIKPRKTASMKQIHKIIKTCIPLEEKAVVCPFGMQDPLLEPQLVEILQSIKIQNKNAYTIIYTTMDNMNDHLLESLLESMCLNEIVISGPYGSQWQKGMDDNKTNNNIEEYKKPLINMNWIETIPGFEEHKTKWGNRVNSIRKVSFDTFHGTMKMCEGMTKPKNELKKNEGRCMRLWNTLNINSSGDIIPCCLDFTPLEPMGNMNDARILDIWNGKKFNQMRELHMTGRRNEIDLCKECPI